jgi:hypothetical protein
MKAKSFEGIAIKAPFSWSFKTRAEAGFCTIDHLICAPSSITMSFGSTANLRARGYNQTSCNICPDVGPWDWQTIDNSLYLQSNQTAVANITALKQDDQTGVKVTNSRQPGLIPAQCSVKVTAQPPKVVIDQTCDTTIQSPTPFVDSTNICSNSLIGVRFNENMQPSTLNNYSFIVKNEAGNNIPLQLDSYIYGSQNWEVGVLFKPNQPLESNKKYHVILNSSYIKSQAGLPLDPSSLTDWWFTVGTAGDCKLKKVLVNPSQKQMAIGQSAEYRALAIGNNCQTLTPATTGWSWRSTISSVATSDPSTTFKALIHAIANGLTYIRASLNGKENAGDNGKLIVGSGGQLKIIKVEPLGNNACTNAMVRITFNKPLKPETVNTATIKLSSGLNNGNIILSADKMVVEINKSLSSQTNYNVAVVGSDAGLVAFDDNKLNADGCSLAGLTWQPSTNECQWGFSTGSEQCSPDRMELEPMSAFLRVGEQLNWTATAYNQSTPLNSSFNWQILNSELLTFAPNFQQPNRFATTTALASGTTTMDVMSDISDRVHKTAKVEIIPELIGSQLISFTPISPPNVCRNSLIKAEFDKPLKPGVISGNAKVMYQGASCGSSSEPEPIGRFLPANKFIRIFYDTLSLASKFISGQFGQSLSNLFVKKVLADSPWCPVEGTWSTVVVNNKQQLIFTQSQALPANAKIRVKFNGNGLVDESDLPARLKAGLTNGQIFDDNWFGWEFYSGTNVCRVSYVDVYADDVSNKKEWTFNRSDNDISDDYPGCYTSQCDTINDNDKVFKSFAKTSDGQTIVSIPAVYSWNWSWSTSDAGVVGLKPVEISAGNPLADQQLVVAEKNNGEATIGATATFSPTANQLAITGFAKANVFLCANPWPKVNGQWAPLSDNRFNFSFSYCRDAGATGEQDDLPELKYTGQKNRFTAPKYKIGTNNLPICSQSATGYCLSRGYISASDIALSNNSVACALFTGSSNWSQIEEKTVEAMNCVGGLIYNDYNNQKIGDNDMLRQYLFEVPETSGDAIALRLYENNYENDVVKWYEYNVSNPGSPQTIANGINNYPAIKENNSTYVVFADQADPVSKPNQARSYAIVASYNQDASANTANIAKQIINNLRFNKNIESVEQKQKLRRDFRRVLDMQKMANAVFLGPALSEGTYVPGMSLSVWPSWQKTLGAGLNIGLPLDPINKLGACSDCVNTENYRATFESNEDVNKYTNINSSLMRVCTGLIKAAEGQCYLLIKTNSGYSGGQRIVKLSGNTTYRLTAKAYIRKSGPDVTIKVVDTSQSVEKSQILNHGTTDSWRDVQLDFTTNNSGYYVISFTKNGNEGNLYIDDFKIIATSGRCADYDTTTCWNPNANNNAGEFSCSRDSYAYLYKYNKLEPQATLRGKFYALTELVNNWIDDAGVNTYLSSLVNLLSPAGNLPVCNNTTVGSTCGDGIVRSPELCEPDDTVSYCQAGKNWYNPAVSTCMSTGVNACMAWIQPTDTDVCDGMTASKCCGGYCGDGVLNARPSYRLQVDEQCDASVVSGDKGFGVGSGPTNQYGCSSSCHDIGGWCGDNVVQTQSGEQCDGINGLLAWTCSDGSVPTCNNCRIACSGGATPYRGFCGNNSVELGEQCDFCGNGLQSVPGQGECSGRSVSAQYFCQPAGVSNQCTWTGGWCGDGQINYVNGQRVEYCDWSSGGSATTTLPATNHTRDCVDHCQQYQCQVSYFDCDRDPANGCEVNGDNGKWVYKNNHLVSADPPGDPAINPPTTQQINDTELINCGGCTDNPGASGTICAWVPHSVPKCSQGQCKLDCLPGYIDSNQNYQDGCETAQ